MSEHISDECDACGHAESDHFKYRGCAHLSNGDSGYMCKCVKYQNEARLLYIIATLKAELDAVDTVTDAEVHAAKQSGPGTLSNCVIRDMLEAAKKARGA